MSKREARIAQSNAIARAVCALSLLSDKDLFAAFIAAAARARDKTGLSVIDTHTHYVSRMLYTAYQVRGQLKLEAGQK